MRRAKPVSFGRVADAPFRDPPFTTITTMARAGDPSGFAALNTLFAEFFAGAPPVRSTPLVQLPKGLFFSIDAIAVVDRE